MITERRTARHKELVKRAAELRRNATIPERRLWNVLSAGQLSGLKFRRQHVIGPYIVDLYCATVALVVEIDGQSHDGRKEHDDERTRWLEELGLRVLRVSNDDVLSNLDGVIELIVREANR